MVLKKQYARREVKNYRSPYPDPFTYRSMAEIGTAAFVSAFSAVNTGSLGRDIQAHLKSPTNAFQEMIDFANSAFNPENWKVAYQNDRLVGMILPTQYYDDPEEGSLFHFGLTPEFRGKGLGKILHAKGLQDLGELGLLRYVGSTDIENLPMIRVFLENGCKLTSIREQTWGVE